MNLKFGRANLLLSRTIKGTGAQWFLCSNHVPEGRYPDRARSQVKMLVDYVRYYRPPTPPSIVTNE